MSPFGKLKNIPWFTRRIKILYISEIFYSIQGESTFAGLPCVFIRLSECNLRCRYCDTQYAWEKGAEMSTEAILKEIHQYECNLVEITGGEPLLQNKTPLLIDKLLESGKKVLVETNGTQPIDKINPKAIRIIDVKLTGSGEQNSFHKKNLEYITYTDELKFVISNRQDFDEARDFICKNKLEKHTLLFSPVSEQMDSKLLAQWILDEKITARLHLQLHRIIWPNEERGH